VENTPVNQIYMAVRGKVGLTNELELDHDYTVTVACEKKEDSSNADGSVDRTFKCKLFLPEPTDHNIDDWKELAGKSRSLRHRNLLFRYWENKTDKSVPFEKYYDLYYDKKDQEIIDKLD
jgi:hypothetical protein